MKIWAVFAVFPSFFRLFLPFFQGFSGRFCRFSKIRAGVREQLSGLDCVRQRIFAYLCTRNGCRKAEAAPFRQILCPTPTWPGCKGVIEILIPVIQTWQFTFTGLGIRKDNSTTSTGMNCRRVHSTRARHIHNGVGLLSYRCLR